MGSSSNALGFFKKRFNALLEQHDIVSYETTENHKNGNGYNDGDLSRIVDELHQLIRHAARTKPTSNQDVALLLHMAIINLGIDEQGDLPGHKALRAALRYLEGDKRHKAKFQKMKLLA